MRKLKTLKDLKTFDWKEDKVVGRIRKYLTCNQFKDELKAEAVKWVKYLEDSLLHQNRSDVKFIKHFFNLTEEDLK